MTNIKERVILIAQQKGLNKTDFFKDLGLSYANFKGVQKSTSLGSDAVVTILSKYTDVNPEWLITGVGEMFRSGATLSLDNRDNYLSASDFIEQVQIESLQEVVAALKQTVQSQAKTIASLEQQVVLLSKGKKGVSTT